MMILRNLVLILSFIVLYGCSSLGGLDAVLPDKRTEYQKSRGMAALEVPPDLTVTEGQYSAKILGEESNSLSELERQRSQNKRQGSVLGSGEADGEQWLALKGSSIDIWPKLREFWNENDYAIELNDAELGVLETAWKEDGGSRHKFKIFAEPDESGGTILFMSSEKQVMTEGEWLDVLVDVRLEKNVIRKLNLHFYGSEVPGDTSTASSSSRSTTPEPAVASKPEKTTAEILNVGDGKSYLIIPQEFTRAWREAQMILDRSGYLIEASDQSKGTYEFRYFMAEAEKEEKGILSKLKFWGDDEDEGTPYQLSLTGVGDRTEVIVMNKDGEWSTGADANAILERLKENYNKL